MARLLIRRDDYNKWNTSDETTQDNETTLQQLRVESPHWLPVSLDFALT
jgi:hypothetical protein